MSGRARANGEGSIYPYPGGWAAYVWVTTPAGRKTRKYLYGKDRDELHKRWTELQVKARVGPVASKIPTVAQYVDYWLREVIEPNTAPSTYEKYEILTRRYVVPGLGHKRLDRLQVRDVQTWINRLPKVCQCCQQGKDAAREEVKRRCCAVGECCRDYVSISTVSTIRKSSPPGTTATRSIPLT